MRCFIRGIALGTLAVGALGVASAPAQEGLAGVWQGELTTPAGALTLLLSLDGGSGGTISVPLRGVSGIAVTEATLTAAGDVSFQVPTDRAAFEGHLRDATRLVGEWLQAGQRIPVEFERIGAYGEAPEPSLRRQTPAPPFPYLVEDLVVSTDQRLACTITRPRDVGRPVPGAVLLTVAGANDRDQTHSGHKPFMVLADHLTRSGIAVLRCDDRGVGGSSGDLSDTTVEDLVADALAMIRELEAQDGIGSIGVIGNSEGSVVGALAAVAAPDEVAFVILLGGVGVRGAEVIRARLVAQARMAGQTMAAAEASVSTFDALTDLVTEAGGVGIAELQQSRPEIYERFAAIAREVGEGDPFLPSEPEERVTLFAGAWYHAQLTLDGGSILAQVAAPVLALTGSKDRTNLPEQNLPAIRRALERAGNTDVRVDEVPDLNHVFQTAVVGGFAEYGTLEESFSPIALVEISEWILQRFEQS